MATISSNRSLDTLLFIPLLLHPHFLRSIINAYWKYCTYNAIGISVWCEVPMQISHQEVYYYNSKDHDRPHQPVSFPLERGFPLFTNDIAPCREGLLRNDDPPDNQKS